MSSPQKKKRNRQFWFIQLNFVNDICQLKKEGNLSKNDKIMKITIGSDHAGYSLKEFLKSKFSEIEFIDKGCYSLDSVDYPDFAHQVADAIAQKETSLGILICGSANGVSISANRHAGVRSAIAWTPEIAALARQHNDANILALPARFISELEAIEIVKTFLNTDFEGGRHQTRVDKIDC